MATQTTTSTQDALALLEKLAEARFNSGVTEDKQYGLNKDGTPRLRRVFTVETIDSHYNKELKKHDRLKSLGFQMSYNADGKYISVRVAECWVRIYQDPSKDDGFMFDNSYKKYNNLDDGSRGFRKEVDAAKFSATKKYLLQHMNFKNMKWSTLKKKATEING